MSKLEKYRVIQLLPESRALALSEFEKILVDHPGAVFSEDDGSFSCEYMSDMDEPLYPLILSESDIKNAADIINQDAADCRVEYSASPLIMADAIRAAMPNFTVVFE